ncbi:hypothetical protein DPMN_079079 [Dreissena polymorpha]|uniref:Uncharacterized protein n=1 Tax=Dreissena polymorpha TaxID=45954 RepID=A0A9D3YNE8_DREPO|nr:hypothetical protein DPMN_079079 [Dreissena polymorpha]
MNEEKRSIWTSVALANALNDIGVNVETIQLRRATWLYIEALFTIKEKAMDSDVDVYIFGSQTEGTTTDDMHSDMDMLKNDRTVSVIYDIADWKFGPVQLFMVMDMSSPPQCCCLQGVQLINPELVTERKLPDHHIDAQGRVFVKNTLNEMGDQWGCDLYGISHVRHGPSRTLGEVIDLVRAFHCAKLPADCQFIFRRPKPGHWPSQELLTQLKDSGVFLVPTALVENTTNWDPGHHLATLTASMKASLSIGQNQILPEEIFTLCNKSLTSDVTSSRLKLASIYFSLRRFKEADAILRQVDALISNKVMHYRPFREFKLDSDVLKRRKEFPDILQNEIAMCTIFSRHEINCVPGQLVAEFYRTVTKEDAEHRHQIVFNVWLDHAVVDSKTYMYYLKYLTSQLNGFISDKHSAFDHLQDHVFSDLEDHLNKDDVFSDEVMLAHFETSLNLLGHCWELEGGEGSMFSDGEGGGENSEVVPHLKFALNFLSRDEKTQKGEKKIELSVDEYDESHNAPKKKKREFDGSKEVEEEEKEDFHQIMSHGVNNGHTKEV